MNHADSLLESGDVTVAVWSNEEGMHPVRNVVCTEQKKREGMCPVSKEAAGKEQRGGQLSGVIMGEKRRDLQGTCVLPLSMNNPPRTTAPWCP